VRILFDQGTPVPLRDALQDHEISTSYELGWSKLENGDLLDAAEEGGFQVFTTTDQNLRYQQDLGSRYIAIVVLTTTSWPRIRREIPAVADAVEKAADEEYVEVVFSTSDQATFGASH
jgi:hypothetical protein